MYINFINIISGENMISNSLYNDFFKTTLSTDHSSIMNEERVRQIQQIRNESLKNENKLLHQKRIYYGLGDIEEKEYEENRENMSTPPGFSLKIRFVIAVFMLTFFVLMDLTGKPLGKIKIETIKESISLDYESFIVSYIQNNFPGDILN